MTDITYNRIPGDALNRWATVRVVLEGSAAQRQATLPELNAHDQSEENRERNKAYKQRAVWYGVMRKTLDGYLGMAFRKDPRTDLPPKLEVLKRNADGAGNSIYQQSQEVLACVLGPGRHGLYVDYDSDLAQPVIKSYRAESIINWRTDKSGRLVLVVLSEKVDEPDGFGVKTVEQYRELALEEGKFVCRVHRKTEGGFEIEELQPKTGKGVLTEIPFAFVGSQNNDPNIDGSPLYDLAELNLAHYRNSADYEDSVFYVGQAQPYISGLNEQWRDHLERSKTAYVGSRHAILLPEGGAYGFAQPSPNGMVKEAMDQKEQQMVALGARLLDPNSARQTATHSENDRETSTSVLSLCVANVNEAYQRTIQWCAQYVTETLTADQALGSFKISQDFGRKVMEPQLLQAIVSAWQAQAIAKPDMLAYLRAEGVIAAERTDEEIEADLEAEGPSLGVLGGE